MWFVLSILALLMLSSRRTAEKKAASNVDSMAMAWLQQAVALPFIILSLLITKFYLPSELPALFWWLLAVYIVLQSVYLYCYYRAISIADISFVAPLMTLFLVGNMIGAYLILGQFPSVSGVVGAAFIITGAWIVTSAKKHKDNASTLAHKTAFILVMVAIIVCSIFSNLEVIMLRMSNPTSYNFYTSVLTVPFVMLVTLLILKSRHKSSKDYFISVNTSIKTSILPLIIVGFTYTVNMLATYQAKVLAPNQAYVGVIKAASVIPVVVFGVLFFNEKVSLKQWLGIGCMLIGLLLIAANV